MLIYQPAAVTGLYRTFALAAIVLFFVLLFLSVSDQVPICNCFVNVQVESESTSSLSAHPRLTFFSLPPKQKNISLGGKLVWIRE